MQVGEIKIDFLGHDGFVISNGKRIAIDPYNVSDNVEKVDLILITHEHFDHCSLKDIEKLSKSGTLVIGPPHIQSTVVRIKDVQLHPIEVGDKFEMAGIKIETIASYNLNKFRDPERKIVFHQKKEGYVGYIIKFANVIIYHAGDTDLIPEMKNLTGYGKHGNNFIALLPISGKYVMDVDEAVEAAKLIRPTIAIPMHYGSGIVGTSEDAENFVKQCRELGIQAHVLEKI